MAPWTVATSAPSEAPTPDQALTQSVVRSILEGGAAAVGVASAEQFTETRHSLIARKEAGLHGGMAFTYRNPDRSTDPSRTVPGARTLVSAAWSYRAATPSSSADHRLSLPSPTGVVARYARHDHYADLRAALDLGATVLRGHGYRAVVAVDDNALVDRAAAHRAGLGWFGKNSLLLLPELGSWFVLGSIVTDAPLEVATVAPLAHGSGCGSCTRCQQDCPTGALDTAGVVDARRCLAWLLQAPGSFPAEFRAALGGRIYGCDTCQEVCPINRVADRRHPPTPVDVSSDPGGERGTQSGTESGVEAGVDLLALLALSDADLLERHGRWYIAERSPRYVRRNALIALGNTGSGDDPATVQTLQHFLAVDDALLREHAAWAAAALGRADLVNTELWSPMPEGTEPGGEA